VGDFRFDKIVNYVVKEICLKIKLPFEARKEDLRKRFFLLGNKSYAFLARLA
jgi:hypothetical protein